RVRRSAYRSFETLPANASPASRCPASSGLCRKSRKALAERSSVVNSPLRSRRERDAAAGPFRPVRKWSGNWPSSGRPSSILSRWALIRTSSRSARTPLRTQMISRLRERFNVYLSFKDIFHAPTVTALAARLELSQKRSASLSLRDPLADIARLEG